MLCRLVVVLALSGADALNLGAAASRRSFITKVCNCAQLEPASCGRSSVLLRPGRHVVHPTQCQLHCIISALLSLHRLPPPPARSPSRRPSSPRPLTSTWWARPPWAVSLSPSRSPLPSASPSPHPHPSPTPSPRQPCLPIPIYPIPTPHAPPPKSQQRRLECSCERQQEMRPSWQCKKM